MLVIRRHGGQSVLIGDAIEIEVIEAGPNRVKLGIRAPRDVSVMRKEVQLTREANLSAARTVEPPALANILELLHRQYPSPTGWSEDSLSAAKSSSGGTNTQQ